MGPLHLFLSHSTKSSSRRSAVATDPLAAKRAKRTPNATEGNGSSHSVDNAVVVINMTMRMIIPATDGPIVTTAQDAAAELFC